MKKTTGRKGFSLIELMIVIAVVAILVALALPSYTGYVRKAKRAEAQKILVNWANLQEIWRANHSMYAPEKVENADPALAIDGLDLPTHGHYTFSISGSLDSGYTLTATPGGDQTYDKDKDVSCNPISMTETGEKFPQNDDGVSFCW